MSSCIDFPRSSWRALDVTAARGAGIPSIFSRHEKATNASQAFEKGSGSSLLVTLTTYSMILYKSGRDHGSILSIIKLYVPLYL